MIQVRNFAIIFLLAAFTAQVAPFQAREADAGTRKSRIADEDKVAARKENPPTESGGAYARRALPTTGPAGDTAFMPSFGKIAAVFQVGSEEDRLGVIRTSDNRVPFGMYYGPSSFVFDAAGTLYVVDCRNYRVSVFDPENKYSFVKSISYFTDRDHKSFVNDVAVDRGGSVYLADSANRNILKFSALGLPEAVIGAPAPPAFKGLSQPGEIAVDAKGNIYVRDFGADAVFVFAPDGKFAGELKMNTALYFNSKNMRYMIEYHADSESWKIFEETEKGETQRMIYEISREAKEQNVQIIGIDSNDDIYLKTFRSGAIGITKITADGKPVSTFAAHNQPDFDTTRYFFVDPKRRAVFAVRYNGRGVEIDELTAK